MLKLFLFFTLGSFGLASYTQFNKPALKYYLRNVNVSDSADLDLVIVYENASKSPFYVYKELIKGNIFESFSNIMVTLDRLEGKVYKKAYYSSTGRFYENGESEDSIFHANLEILSPGKKKEIKLNLLAVFMK